MKTYLACPSGGHFACWRAEPKVFCYALGGRTDPVGSPADQVAGAEHANAAEEQR
jgi:hypothetical protein